MIVTVKEHDAVRLTGSVAIHVIVLTPALNETVDVGMLHVTVTEPLMSEAVGRLQLTRPNGELGAVTPERFGGQVIVGGVVCWTVTVNEQLAELPLGSAAMHVTFVDPYGKLYAVDGEHRLDATIPLLSEAVSVYETVA